MVFFDRQVLRWSMVGATNVTRLETVTEWKWVNVSIIVEKLIPREEDYQYACKFQIGDYEKCRMSCYDGVVTESARACSYHSISTGMQTATPPGCTIFDPRVKSVLYTFCSVRKCRRHTVYRQKMSY